jgi:hypothetical protein
MPIIKNHKDGSDSDDESEAGLVRKEELQSEDLSIT